jgi:pyruvate formate lyase activating enzyme
MLVDLKIMDREKHLMYTGVDNHVILENIRWLAASGHAFSIRIPLIEGVNADEENIMATGRFLRALPWENPVVHLLPYHDVGKDKHRRMWSVYNPKGYSMAAPSDEQIAHCKTMLSEFGLQVIVGG